MRGKIVAAGVLAAAGILAWTVPARAGDTIRLNLTADAPTRTLVDDGQGADTVAVRHFGGGGFHHGGFGGFRGGFGGFHRGGFGGFRSGFGGFRGGFGGWGRGFGGWGRGFGWGGYRGLGWGRGFGWGGRGFGWGYPYYGGFGWGFGRGLGFGLGYGLVSRFLYGGYGGYYPYYGYGGYGYGYPYYGLGYGGYGYPYYGIGYGGYYSPYYYGSSIYYSYPYVYGYSLSTGTNVPVVTLDGGPSATVTGTTSLIQTVPGDGTFPYDGGPKNAVPLPQDEVLPAPNVQPAPATPSAAPKVIVPAEGRVVSLPKKPAKWAYPAYGEQPRRTSFAEDRTALLTTAPAAKKPAR